jgi:ferric-dicitrate binding protein FerR (iron transport regulator)
MNRAKYWLKKLKKDSSQATRQRFLRWVTRSPKHMEAFLYATAFARMLQ